MKRKHMIYFGVFLLIIYITLQSILIYGKYTGIRDELGENAIMLSKMISTDINIQEYKEIVSNKEKNVNYYKLQQKFKNIKEITGAKYIYIESKINENEIEYIIDASGDSLGEIDNNGDNVAFNNPNSTSIGTDTAKWGELITGFTPILDENNKVIGLIGVDYEFGFNVLAIRSELIDGLKSSLIMTILLGIFILFLYVLGRIRDKNTMKRYGDFVNALTIMLFRKSDYTGKHSENVSVLSEILARKFFKDERKIETIKWASILHDIGKIGVSGAILDKPGKLTDEEFEKIKQHPIYSKEALENVFKKDNDLFDDKEIVMISDIAKYHHERWDGKGYPCGLKGEEIPFIARIVSVTDAYEAMTAERPYKKPMEKEDAVNQIIKCSGTQFDPEIVAKFLECVREGSI